MRLQKIKFKLYIKLFTMQKQTTNEANVKTRDKNGQNMII